jgi:hypothetical protein
MSWLPGLGYIKLLSHVEFAVEDLPLSDLQGSAQIFP